jgi:ethanolamine utilization protein EutS
MSGTENKGTRAYVPGKQITLAHLIANPDPELCAKVGVPDSGAIGILTLTPGETAIIAGDVAVKTASVHLAFLDRFSGTLVVYGSVGDVQQALHNVNNMLTNVLRYTGCTVTGH